MTQSTPPDTLDLSNLTELVGGDVKGCCAGVYAHPAVRWLLGDEFHPGGAQTTRHALELIGAGRDERLLDVASGTGDSAMLAAGERGCIVTGIDYGEAAVIDAERAAAARGHGERVSFRVGDAEALPFEDQAFDAVLCECSLCTFPDKHAALTEVRRVLRPGGRFALTDVIADHGRLPASLSGPLAAVACVGTAVSREELLRLLHSTGFELFGTQSCTEEAAELAERVYDRLRAARILLSTRIDGSRQLLSDAIEIVAAARAAIADGALDYAIFAAAR